MSYLTVDPLLFVVSGTVSVALGLFILALTDMQRFEIDPLALILVTCGAGVIYLNMGFGFSAGLGAASLLLSIAVVLRQLRPGSIGEGDLGLFAAMGFLSGPFVFVFTAVFAGTALLTARAYAIARGKSGIRSSVPAAVPATMAGGFCFILQLWGKVF
jgi:hypothetical protein